jgi:CspA family cold shock protein
MNGLWRFAAPFSFSRLSQHRWADRRPAITEGKSEMTIGTVKFFNADKGYGFIQPDGGGNDAFVHISAVQAAGMQTLDRDQRVSYELETDRRGKTSAVNLQSA